MTSAAEGAFMSDAAVVDLPPPRPKSNGGRRTPGGGGLDELTLDGIGKARAEWARSADAGQPERACADQADAGRS